MNNLSHRSLMMRAIRLAGKAEGRTFPNPMVGAVIVKKGKIIGQGYHKKAGKPHAEIEAINNAKEETKGSDLYVSLEPCSHYGRTPPCVDRIVLSGIKTVYVAMQDPNPLVNGMGLEMLRQNGIAVRVGICRNEAMRLNKRYLASLGSQEVSGSVKCSQA